MEKYNMAMDPAPPGATWREAARRALEGPALPPALAREARLVARPALWEGRRHLEALEGGGHSRPALRIRPTRVATMLRPRRALAEAAA